MRRNRRQRDDHHAQKVILAEGEKNEGEITEMARTSRKLVPVKHLELDRRVPLAHIPGLLGESSPLLGGSVHRKGLIPDGVEGHPNDARLLFVSADLDLAVRIAQSVRVRRSQALCLDDLICVPV